MNYTIRFVVQLRNGGYMKSEWDRSLDGVKLDSVDNVIDADLYKSKIIAERILDEILTGNTNLLTLYDEDNPPVKVLGVKIDTVTSN